MLQRPLFFCHAIAFFQIAACTKYFFTCAREYHAANISGIGSEAIPEIKHVMPHLGVDSIAHVGAVDRDF